MYFSVNITSIVIQFIHLRVLANCFCFVFSILSVFIDCEQYFGFTVCHVRSIFSVMYGFICCFLLSGMAKDAQQSHNQGTHFADLLPEKEY